MNKGGTLQHIRNIIMKTMGLLVAPLTFSCVIFGILFLIASVTAGDIIGYGSVLLMDQPEQDYDVSNILAPVEDGENTKDSLSIKDITFPTYEQPYGEISISSVDILCPLIYGDTDVALKRGAGQFIGSSIVGFGGTTMICAHVNRQFTNLNKVQIGDVVQIRTTYGVYTYTVNYVGVHDASDDSIYDLSREDENLVLYTCYYERTFLGNVKKRFFVCADYTSGPLIEDWRYTG